ncbi:hypothetical protein GBAR_LOCUS20324 [Geodia barretti]|uniref:Sushi domain-containing protein n=1 Tax=Geodia barretti TaxID=519541 RepID=A0AA35X325_GEOBA|nr:hypothetical protein GBAR_LOCUS20324 [Geodia barretti]
MVAKYSCHEGTLVGPEMRTCLENCSWSGVEPSCRADESNGCSSPPTRQCVAPFNYCGSLRGPNGYQDITCVDGQCQCPGNAFYDHCTCLPHIGSCLIKQDSASIVGTPTTDGDSETTYGCVASDNCNYEVHVIGNYESSNGTHGVFTDRVAGDTDVIVSVSGESPRPLILVLTSYEPVRWRLSVTSGVTIDRVILVMSQDVIRAIY